MASLNKIIVKTKLRNYEAISVQSLADILTDWANKIEAGYICGPLDYAAIRAIEAIIIKVTFVGKKEAAK